jgi:hypothetical protein
MKRRLLLLLSSLLATAVLLWATTQGPNNPTLGINVAGAGVDWATPTNIYASDDARATAALAAGQNTDYLRATGFGFAIPVGSTINGIIADFERSKTGTGDCEDYGVQIVQAGVEAGADRAHLGLWPGADAYDAHGGAADLWGLAWTPAQINAVNFGVSIQAYETGAVNACTARVDHVRITVYYTAASSRKAYIINAQRREAGRGEPVLLLGRVQGCDFPVVRPTQNLDTYRDFNTGRDHSGGPLPMEVSIPLDVELTLGR